MENASRDENRVTTLLGVSSADGVSPINLWVNPDNHRLIVESVGGTIIGPGSSTDKAIVRWDGTNGTTIQDSSVIVSNAGDIDTSGAISTPGLITGGSAALSLINTDKIIGGPGSNSAPTYGFNDGGGFSTGIYQSGIQNIDFAIAGAPTFNMNSSRFDAPAYSAGGTPAVADGTYTVGIGVMTNGTITVKGGIITAVQEAS